MPILNVNLNINEVSRQTRLNPFLAIGGVTASFVSGGINYISHTFYSSSGVTADQTFTVLNGEIDAQVLVVGGGGPGAAGGTNDGNAGGAGGVVYSGSYHLQINPIGASTYTIRVAKGGTPLLAPESSSFIPTYVSEGSPIIISYPGGSATAFSKDGASGAAGSPTGSAIYGTQGRNGGLDQSTSGAGGGGWAAQGTNSGVNGGDGGAGIELTLQDGTTKYYAGGGGGGAYISSGAGIAGQGGSGVGGNGGTLASVNGGKGVEGTGGGGGGGAVTNNGSGAGSGGNGGSGVVIITYPVS